MTDRELLKWAAKAAGIVVLQEDEDFWIVKTKDRGLTHWNPLINDGDALRLAVRLAMSVRQEPSAAAAGWDASCLVGVPTSDGRGPWFWKEWLSDALPPDAATRRAIVRAAAEIGWKMAEGAR